jgi:hypothetical protein
MTGPIEQPHVRPWSTAMRIPTDGTTVWFKASGPGAAHEGPLLEAFRRHGVTKVLLPLAIHPERPWMLLDDGGPTLRATRPGGTGDHDIAAWERILPEYAALQRSVEGEGTRDEMVAAGVPDGRPSRLPGELARLLEDDVAWSRITDDERAAADAARRRLRGSLTTVEAVVAELETAGIPASIQHDDLHGGNILVGPGGDRFFDWGDAVIAHPFSTLATTFNSIAHHTGRVLDDPVFDRLRDVYTQVWSDRLPGAELARAVALARALGCISKSLAWERALTGLEPDEMDGYGDGVAGWLMEFDERFEALTR